MWVFRVWFLKNGGGLLCYDLSVSDSKKFLGWIQSCKLWVGFLCTLLADHSGSWVAIYSCFTSTVIYFTFQYYYLNLDNPTTPWQPKWRGFQCGKSQAPNSPHPPWSQSIEHDVRKGKLSCRHFIPRGLASGSSLSIVSNWALITTKHNYFMNVY